MFGSFDFQEFLSAFIVLFAVIDIIGSIPIILNLKQKGRNVNANKATGISFALLIGFFCGAYTSIFIASPLWVTFRRYSDKKRLAKRMVDTGK